MLAAVIVALGLGVTSILHTQSLQKRERKERLLNEIIQWANDVTKGTSEVNTPIAPRLGDETIEQVTQRSKLLKYVTINAKSEYIKRIASVFEEGLVSDVEKVTQNLNLVIYFLMQLLDYKQIELKLLERMPWLKSEEMPPVTEETLSKGKETLLNMEWALHTSAINLMNKTAKIKTRDIS